MVKIIGRYESGVGGGGETASLPLLSVAGDWPLGSQPGSITCEIAGPEMFGSGAPVAGAPVTTAGGIDLGVLERFCSPDRARSVSVGDAGHSVTFRGLFVSTADPSEIRAGRGSITITLNDRRIWWQRRAAIGARAYNLEQNGERVSPFQTVTPTPLYGSNPRMHAHSIRTAEEIILEIMASLGENSANVKLRGGNGFSDLSQVGTGVGGLPGGMLEDTPPWSQSEGDKPVACLEKFCAMYGLIVAISPDSEDVGFIHEGDIASKLGATLAALKALQPVDPSTLAAVSVGFDREAFPDVLYIHGAPLMIGDLLTLEPVARDPDQPERFIPLFMPATLEAYGMDLSIVGRQNLPAGARTYGLAMAIAMMEDMAPEIPPRLHSMVREWGRFWRVAMPIEVVNAPTADDGTRETAGSSTRSARVVIETDPNTGLQYTRVKSPRYRLLRDGAQPGGTKLKAAGRTLWQPQNGSTAAEIRRWFPIKPHTEKRTSDGSYSRLRVLGCNVIRSVRVLSQQGQSGLRWVDIGKRILPAQTPTFPGDEGDGDLVDLGLEPTLVDPELGVVDLGEPILGNDGTSRLSDLLRAVPGMTPSLLQARYEVCMRGDATETVAADLGLGPGSGGLSPIAPTAERQCALPPLGLPYLVLHCATAKQAHGDERDCTSSHSDIPGHGGTDPFSAADNVLPALRTDLYASRTVGALPPAPGNRGHALEIWDHAIGDLELRCKTSRVVAKQALHSFVRDGGWSSGEMGGACNFMDVELTTLDTAKASGLSAGRFCPDSRAHYRDIMRGFTDAVARFSFALSAYRSTTNGVKSVTAELEGVHRDFLPGVSAFASHPVDGIYFSGSGDSSACTMRVAANSRGFRAYVGAAMDRYNEELARARAAGAVTTAALQGGGV